MVIILILISAVLFKGRIIPPPRCQPVGLKGLLRTPLAHPPGLGLCRQRRRVLSGVRVKPDYGYARWTRRRRRQRYRG